MRSRSPRKLDPVQHEFSRRHLMCNCLLHKGVETVLCVF
uniref:Uncharacterized protein n=1 Tax=Rhizophora mucronata TaxID=61149 RepID=A0A2P2PSG1_RHIMU